MGGSIIRPISTNQLSRAIRRVTENFTATNKDHIILADATAGPITIFLPTALADKDKTLLIKRLNGNSNRVTILPEVGDTIDDQTSVIISVQYDAVTIFSDRDNWWIL